MLDKAAFFCELVVVLGIKCVYFLRVAGLDRIRLSVEGDTGIFWLLSFFLLAKPQISRWLGGHIGNRLVQIGIRAEIKGK